MTYRPRAQSGFIFTLLRGPASTTTGFYHATPIPWGRPVPIGSLAIQRQHWAPHPYPVAERLLYRTDRQGD